MCSQARYISCSAISCRPLFLFKAAALKLEGKNQTRGDFHSLSIFLFVFNYSDQRLDIEIHYDFRAARPEQLPNATLQLFFFPFTLLYCGMFYLFGLVRSFPATENDQLRDIDRFARERERERERALVCESRI